MGQTGLDVVGDGRRVTARCIGPLNAVGLAVILIDMIKPDGRGADETNRAPREQLRGYPSDRSDRHRVTGFNIVRVGLSAHYRDKLAQRRQPFLRA